ncbi:unnamed protein product, partial [Trichogramma brassicae]
MSRFLRRRRSAQQLEVSVCCGRWLLECGSVAVLSRLVGEGDLGWWARVIAAPNRPARRRRTGRLHCALSRRLHFNHADFLFHLDLDFIALSRRLHFNPVLFQLRCGVVRLSSWRCRCAAGAGCWSAVGGCVLSRLVGEGDLGWWARVIAAPNRPARRRRTGR